MGLTFNDAACKVLEEQLCPQKALDQCYILNLLILANYSAKRGCYQSQRSGKKLPLLAARP